MEIKNEKGKTLFSISDVHYKFLMRCREKINKEDQEVWICFGGDTGTGKSLKAMHWAYIIDPTICVDRICFDKKEFINAVINAKKGEVIIADEGIAIFFSRASMTKDGRLIAELSAQIRQKNLAIFICLPELLSLDWTIQSKINAYVDVWENRMKLNGRLQTYKGCCALYPEFPGLRKKTQFLNWLKIHKRNPMKSKGKPKPFSAEKGTPIGGKHRKPFYPGGKNAEAIYKEKKESVLKKYGEKGEEENKLKPLYAKWKQQRDRAIKLLKDTTGMTHRVLEKKLDIPKGTIGDAIIEQRRIKNALIE